MFPLKHKLTQSEDTAPWRLVWGFRTWVLCRLFWAGQKGPPTCQEVAAVTIVFLFNPTVNLQHHLQLRNREVG